MRRGTSYDSGRELEDVDACSSLTFRAISGADEAETLLAEELDGTVERHGVW